MSDNLAISIKGVSKYYKLYSDPKNRLKEALHPFGKKYHKKFFALKNIDFDINQGEILGIVGKNGSGKSTLLKLITGVLRPSIGTIVVNGKISALLELGAGFNPEFSGLDNIYFYAAILGASKEKIDETLDDIIAFADIGEFIYQPIKTYSSGMKSRLGFAVAVHIEPEILILDEVLSVGDVLFRRKCYAKMEEFFKSGKTIIYVSHDANSVNKLCGRALLLHNGEVILDADAKVVTQYYEKMLFAKEENVSRVVEEIVEKSLAVANGETTRSIEEDLIPIVTNVKLDEPEAYYIEELKPQSSVVYQDFDVDIIDPHIETLDGRRVNVLVTGDEYVYCYKVKFNIEATNVTYGMMFKDELGVILTGAGMHLRGNSIAVVHVGENHLVKWKFTCHFLEGVYYGNAGAATIQNEEVLILTRIVDAVVFKVANENNGLVQGIVNLGQDVKVELA